MKRLPALLPVLLALILSACGSDNEKETKIPEKPRTNINCNPVFDQPALARLEMPRVKGGQSIVLVHEARLNANTGLQGVNYCTEWDKSIRAQRWSCYQMFGKEKDGTNANIVSRYKVDRDNHSQITPQSQYPNDPYLDESLQFSSDPYWGTGYDHGHICPSGDRLSSTESNYQTFFLTNMQPQMNAFNAGIWERMESQVRDWATRCDTLYVCKGGTIDSESDILRYLGSGANRIPVPKYFFMALLAKTSLGYKALGFYIEHRSDTNKNTPLSEFVVNISDLEQLTGIDFFCNLRDDTEREVETLSKENVRSAWGL